MRIAAIAASEKVHPSQPATTYAATKRIVGRMAASQIASASAASFFCRSRRNARVVDHDIETAKALRRLLDCGEDGVPVRHIDRHRKSLPASGFVSPATACAPSRFRSAQAMAKPSAANRSAMASPMP